MSALVLHPRRGCVVWTGAAGLLLGACGQLLGFEEASLDPRWQTGGADAGASRNVESNAGTVDDSNGEAASSASPDAGGSPPLSPCDAFCTVVMEACQNGEDGSFAVYDSMFSCRKQCELYEPGEAGAATGNTLACRQVHAETALAFPGERAIECPAAGPGGDGICGTNCEGYCGLMEKECSDFLSDDCLSDCAEVIDLGGFNVSQIEGNTLQCRFYHLGTALVGPRLHCPHAAGAYPCSDSE